MPYSTACARGRGHKAVARVRTLDPVKGVSLDAGSPSSRTIEPLLD